MLCQIPHIATGANGGDLTQKVCPTNGHLTFSCAHYSPIYAREELVGQYIDMCIIYDIVHLLG